MASSDQSKSSHMLPGEHVYDGDTYAGIFPADRLEDLKKFQMRDEDIVLVTYPKSGTNWMQEILYLTHHEGKLRSNEVELSMHQRVPILEICLPPPVKTPPLAAFNDKPSPRLFKTHQRSYFFEDTITKRKTKFVVVIRNIKDTLVSYYHFYRSNALLGNFQGDFEEYFELFKEKRLAQGDWFDFTKEWLNYSDSPNFCFFTYENMKRDLPNEVGRLAEFLGKDLSDDVIQDICDQSSLDSMKKNPHMNGSKLTKFVDPKISPFIRKGKVGDWKNHFTQEMIDYIDNRFKEEMKDVDFNFEN